MNMTPLHHAVMAVQQEQAQQSLKKLANLVAQSKVANTQTHQHNVSACNSFLLLFNTSISFATFSKFQCFLVFAGKI